MEFLSSKTPERLGRETDESAQPKDESAGAGSGWERLRRRLLALFRPTRRIRPTGQGFIFMTLTLSIGFAALNTGNNLLYLILAMMLSLLSLSGILAELSISRLEVSRIFPQDAVAGQRMYGLIRIYNPKHWVPVLGIRVDEDVQSPVESQSAFFPVVPARQEQTCAVWYVFPQRGKVRLDQLECWTSFPFGFFIRGLMRSVHADVLVLPPVRAYAGPAPAQRALQGTHTISRRGQGDDFLELRPFQSGDDPRRIHWKSSARRQQLLMRESAEQQRNQVVIRLELQTALPEEEAYEEALISIVSAAAFHLRGGAEVAVETPGVVVPMDGGEAQLLRIRRALALAPRAAEAAEVPVRSAHLLQAAVVSILIRSESTPAD